jgi:hypothetical protein
MVNMSVPHEKVFSPSSNLTDSGNFQTSPPSTMIVFDTLVPELKLPVNPAMPTGEMSFKKSVEFKSTITPVVTP